jgi:hypothetical protein
MHLQLPLTVDFRTMHRQLVKVAAADAEFTLCGKTTSSKDLILDAAAGMLKATVFIINMKR